MQQIIACDDSAYHITSTIEPLYDATQVKLSRIFVEWMLPL